MNDKSKEILKEAGWYEGRKINIDYLISKCKKKNIGIFSSVENFLSEFGNIVIKSEDGYPYHEFDEPIFYSEVLSKTVGEPVMRVGIIEGHMINLYISKSGKVYDDQGILGNDIYEAWDCILDTIPSIERKKRRKLWDELGLKEVHRENFEEYYHGKLLKNKILKLQEEGFSNNDIAKKFDLCEEFIIKLLNKEFN